MDNNNNTRKALIQNTKSAAFLQASSHLCTKVRSATNKLLFMQTVAERHH